MMASAQTAANTRRLARRMKRSGRSDGSGLPRSGDERPATSVPMANERGAWARSALRRRPLPPRHPTPAHLSRPVPARPRARARTWMHRRRTSSSSARTTRCRSPTARRPTNSVCSWRSTRSPARRTASHLASPATCHSSGGPSDWAREGTSRQRGLGLTARRPPWRSAGRKAVVVAAVCECCNMADRPSPPSDCYINAWARAHARSARGAAHPTSHHVLCCPSAAACGSVELLLAAALDCRCAQLEHRPPGNLSPRPLPAAPTRSPLLEQLLLRGAERECVLHLAQVGVVVEVRGIALSFHVRNDGWGQLSVEQRVEVNRGKPRVHLDIARAALEVAVPLREVGLQQLLNNVARGAREVRRELDLAVQDLPVGAHRVIVKERRIPREHFINEHAERPPVDRLAVALVENDLRGQVVGRATKRVRAMVDLLCESEVGHLHVAIFVKQ
mmetsp:Transcript_8306/g.33615  ORF Transcript_8306/g.33615 Transcript_8306/m.33615 type:complete len:447 (+) Transcript_8306:240-1580(+)